MSKFLLMDTSCLGLVLKYLEVKDVVRVESTKRVKNGHNQAYEEYWRMACIERWNLTSLQVSQHHFKETYRNLLVRKQMPHGKFTSHRVCFGTGNNQHLSGWLMVNHSSDGLLRREKNNRQGVKYLADLQICLQNTTPTVVSLDLTSPNILKIQSIEVDDVEDSAIVVTSIRLLNKNGLALAEEPQSSEKKTTKAQSLSLRYLEFAVITVGVSCPSTIENEPDLLSAIELIEIAHSSSSDQREEVLPIRPVDQNAIWSCYDALPRGIFLLKN